MVRPLKYFIWGNACVWKSENNLMESVFSFHMWDPNVKLRSAGLVEDAFVSTEPSHCPDYEMMMMIILLVCWFLEAGFLDIALVVL